MNKTNLVAVILAAGQSTRMKSKTSKMLHPVCGRSIIRYVIDLVETLQAQQTIMVVGYQAQKIQKELCNTSVKFVYQKEQLGTAHAVSQTKDALSHFSGTVLVLNGDVPLLTFEEITKLIDLHHESQAAATILSGDIPNPFGYGRILRDETGYVLGIIEEKDASEKQKKLKEINTGTYCFDSRFLYDTLSKVDNRNVKKEYYLTDLIALLRQQGKLVQALKVSDFRTALGINTRVDLAEVNRIMRQRLLTQLMLDGVTFIDPHNTYIDFNVKIGQDTVIGPGTVIEGASTIGAQCYIGPSSRIINSTLEDHVYVQGGCFISDSHLPSGLKVLALRQIDHGRPELAIGLKSKKDCIIEKSI